LAELWGLLKDSSLPPADVVAAALDMDTVLGIGLAEARREEKSLSDEERSKIQALVDRRAEAKKAKNWAQADALRQELKDLGIVLEDGPAGTVWKPSKA
jgi:cysteinyl-tRNA synthetase